MLNLPSEVESRFKAGFFAIRQKAGSFNGVWSDMVTEKTIIKDKGNSTPSFAKVFHQRCKMRFK
jgi:hypothetical protein